jgi:hypothetical protein
MEARKVNTADICHSVNLPPLMVKAMASNFMKIKVGPESVVFAVKANGARIREI